jgi:hypothetical protein
MAHKNKYTRFTLEADYGQVSEKFENYREAFTEYQKQVLQGNPATLLGFDEQDNITVIFSHP